MSVITTKAAQVYGETYPDKKKIIDLFKIVDASVTSLYSILDAAIESQGDAALAGAAAGYAAGAEAAKELTEVLHPFNFGLEYEFKSLGYDDVPLDGIYAGSGGPSLSFNTFISSPVTGNDQDNQRTSFLIKGTTRDDGNSEEQIFCILAALETGYAKSWSPATAFEEGDNISFGGARNAVYRCVEAGISAASGSGPTGYGLSIVDGTCKWMWINDAAINAKLAHYTETVARPGVGSGWAQVINFEIESGVLSPFLTAMEIDLTNNCGIDSALGGLNKYGLWIAVQGSNTSTAGLQISSANTTKDATLWGAYFAGSRLATRAVICVDASSAIGIGFGANAGGVVTDPVFTTAVFRDKSLSPVAISLGGKYSSSAISVTSPTSIPSALAISGPKSLVSILDISTAPAAFKSEGTYTIADLQAAGASPTGLAITNAKTISGIYDTTTGPAAYKSQGTYTIADIQAAGASPTGLAISGNKSIAGVVDSSTAPHGFQAVGNYSTAAFASLNFQVKDGVVTAAGLKLLNNARMQIEDANQPRIFVQASAPSAGSLVAGDLWVY